MTIPPPVTFGPKILRPLKVEPRDIGVGRVHFWTAGIPNQQEIHVEGNELLELKWMTVPEIAESRVYRGTRRAIEALWWYWAVSVLWCDQ